MTENISNCCTDKTALDKIAAIAKTWKGRKDMLIEVLLQAQKLADNAITEDVAEIIAKEMGIPLSTVCNAISFYAMFSTEKRGKYIIRMCKSAPCHIKGAEAVMQAFEKALDISCGGTTSDGLFTLETCECIGVCDRAPAVMINDEVYGPLTPEEVIKIVADYRQRREEK
ncbi:MAG: NAD(P)H-dependent oxidoreductase subunit E [Actinomycetota bacterium]|nr:NAD(P)H-dependent oxidoreductase subunit E [Actinomycetota bacterium]